MNIEIKVDTSKFDKLLADVPAALARAQRNALVVIGNAVKNRTTNAFKHPELRPSPWAPRKSGGKWPLLIKHPHAGLWQSFRSKLQGNDTVVIGTDKEYAGYHQTGTKHMPARPFFPVDRSGNLTPDCMREIKEEVEDVYRNELRKIGFK